jgi:hypothetical protein
MIDEAWTAAMAANSISSLVCMEQCREQGSSSEPMAAALARQRKLKTQGRCRPPPQ